MILADLRFAAGKPLPQIGSIRRRRPQEDAILIPGGAPAALVYLTEDGFWLKAEALESAIATVSDSADELETHFRISTVAPAAVLTTAMGRLAKAAALKKA